MPDGDARRASCGGGGWRNSMQALQRLPCFFSHCVREYSNCSLLALHVEHVRLFGIPRTDVAAIGTAASGPSRCAVVGGMPDWASQCSTY